MVNSSSFTGTFPSSFKVAQVAPVLIKSSFSLTPVINYGQSPFFNVSTHWNLPGIGGPIICQHGFSYHCYADISCTCPLDDPSICCTSTSKLTLLKLSCWFSQPTSPFITIFTLKLKPSLFNTSPLFVTVNW